MKTGKQLPRQLTTASMVALALCAWSEASATVCANISSNTTISGATICQEWTGGNLSVTGSGIQLPSFTTAIFAHAISGATLTNTGTISTSYYGFRLTGGADLSSVNNSGLIRGSYVFNAENSTVGTLSNSGTITGVVALYNSGTINSLANTGTLSGTQKGIDNRGTIGTLDNGGTISGPTAIYNNGGTISSLINSGIIIGSINNGSTALNISGASGSAFGTLTGTSGSIGTITSTAAPVSFTGGRILLNDAINAGSGTVANSGATVRVDRNIAITGNYSQGQAGTLMIGVADNAVAAGNTGSDSGYGRLVVSGNATLAAGSSVVLSRTGNSYAFAAGQRYVVITAGGTGTYNESTLRYAIDGSTAFSLSGSNVSNSLVVSLADAPVSSPSQSLATTPNASSALAGLRRYGGIAGGLLDLYNASLAIGSAAQANKAGEQLSPVLGTHAGAAATTATFDSLGVVQNHVNGLRLAQGGPSGVATGESTGSWIGWAQLYGGSAQQGVVDQVSGYKASYSGIVLGGDRMFGERWRAGAAATYSSTSVAGADNLAGSSSHVDSYGLIAYGSYSGDPWYLNLSGSAVRNRYDGNRTVGLTGFGGTAQSSYGGWQYAAKAEFGYPLALAQGFTATPMAALSYSYLKQDAYTETGGNGAALAVQGSHQDAVRSSLGGRLDKSFSSGLGQLTPFVQLMWSHQYNASREATTASFAADSTGATSFTTLGATPVKDVAELTLGLDLVKSSDLTLSARYDLQAARHYDAQTFSVRLQKRF